MANGISVKQAIENELADKTEYTTADTIKCIKHLASGFDNLNGIDKRLDAVENRVKWHSKIFVGIWTVTAGLVAGAVKKVFGL